MSEIAPEQRLRNVARIVLEQATPTRRANGRGRMPSYPAGKHEIAGSALQLAEMILQYLDGELPPSDDDLPF
jgi:hypothetical protein